MLSACAVAENARLVAVTRPSMFEFAGGEQAFLALTAAFHERCLADPELNHPFSHGVNPRHVENLAAYWAEVFGGPPTYSRLHGGQSAMLEIHARQGGEELESRFVACFMQALDDAQLPDDAEFRAAMRSYIEWATRDVVAYSPKESVVPLGLAVPRWSWNGPEPVSRSRG
jgi:hemoglobin